MNYSIPVSWNPFHSSQFITGTDSKFELRETSYSQSESSGNFRREAFVKSSKDVKQINCYDWYPFTNTSALIAYGTSSGTVSLLNLSGSRREFMLFNANGPSKRLCTTVAWNKHNSTQFAAAFENIRNEHCINVWDLQSVTLLKLSQGESVSSLQWLSENGFVLLAGTYGGWIRAYDVRTNNNQPVCSIMAHPASRSRKIKGLRVDPFSTHHFCSFSDSGQADAVKVWDIRNTTGSSSTSAGKPVFQIHTGAQLNGNTRDDSGGAIVDVQYSPARKGVLAVATSAVSSFVPSRHSSSSSSSSSGTRVGGNSNFQPQRHPAGNTSTFRHSVGLYCTAKPSSDAPSTSTPLQSIAVPGPVASLSWQATDARYQMTCKQQELSSEYSASINPYSSSSSSNAGSGASGVLAAIGGYFGSGAVSQTAVSNSTSDAYANWTGFSIPDFARWKSDLPSAVTDRAAAARDWALSCRDTTDYHHEHSSSLLTEHEVRDSGYSFNRLLIATTSGGFLDVEVADRLPLALGGGGTGGDDRVACALQGEGGKNYVRLLSSGTTDINRLSPDYFVGVGSPRKLGISNKGQRQQLALIADPQLTKVSVGTPFMSGNHYSRHIANGNVWGMYGKRKYEENSRLANWAVPNTRTIFTDVDTGIPPSAFNGMSVGTAASVLTATARIVRGRTIAGYSADANDNIFVMIDELDFVYDCIHDKRAALLAIESNPSGNGETQSAEGTVAARASTIATTLKFLMVELEAYAALTRSLYRVWTWIDRFETNTHDCAPDGAPLTLENCGALNIIRSESALQQSAAAVSAHSSTSTSTTTTLPPRVGTTVPSRQLHGHSGGAVAAATNYQLIEYFHPALGVRIFASQGRSTCKKMCGWLDVTGGEQLLFDHGDADDATLDGDDGEDEELSPNNVSRHDKYSAYSSGNSYHSIASSKGAVPTVGKGGKGVFEVEDGTSDSSEGDDDLLEVIVEERALFDSFERAAAIALWHGNISLAVRVLSRGTAEAAQGQSSTPAPDCSAGDGGYFAPNRDSSYASTAAPVSPPADRYRGYSNATFVSESAASITSADRFAHSSRTKSVGGATGDASGDVDENGSISMASEDDEDRTVEWDVRVDTAYIQLVNLVGMCIAGYSHSNLRTGNVTSSSGGGGRSDSVGRNRKQHKHEPPAWVSMCSLVLQNLKGCRRRASAYLTAMLRFLMTNLNHDIEGVVSSPNALLLRAYASETAGGDVSTSGYSALSASSSSTGGGNSSSPGGIASISAGFASILVDDRMALEDRIAFACTYLTTSQLVDWLTTVSARCKQPPPATPTSSSSASASYQRRLTALMGMTRGEMEGSVSLGPNGNTISEFYSPSAMNIEGILISGLGSDGLEILQQYINCSDDIQTAALLVSRIVDNPAVTDNSARTSASASKGASTTRPPPPPIQSRWLHEYRQMLNKWELYTERATLDVELGRRYRMRHPTAISGGGAGPGAGSAHGQGTSAGAGAGGRLGPAGGRPTYGGGGSGKQGFSSAAATAAAASGAAGRGGAAGKPAIDPTKRLLYRVPPHNDFPHIYLKCHFCGTSLPMDAMQASSKSDLRSQKNILNFCSSCNQELPRCYVCRLYMGMINPYLELNRAMKQKRINADNMAAGSCGNISGAGTAGSLLGRKGVPIEHQDSHNSGTQHSSAVASGGKEGSSTIDFSRWFHFCQNCCHGGHADCIDEWFSSEKHQNEGDRHLHRMLKLGDGGAANQTNNESVQPFSFLSNRTCGVNGCNCRCTSI